jgi:chemotaxis protein MotB
VFSELDLPDNGTGASQRWPTQARQAKGASGTDTTAPDKAVDPKLIQAELDLFGQTGDSMVAPELMRHIVTRVTDEGLLIEIFATQDKQLFSPDTADPTPLMRDIAALISRVARTVTNDVALGGYVQARPVVVRLNPVWDLSLRRADRMRQMLETEGLDPRRMRRVTGHADRKPAVHDPMATRNDRIEVILLRN